MPDISPRLSLFVPNDDTLFVTEDIAANWMSLDENVVGWLSGLASERPAADADNAGFLFYATDTNLWTLSDGTTWEDFEGPQGPQGEPGVVISDTAPSATDVLWADTSEPGDAVLPLGGAAGQSLVKVSGADYDTEWADIDGLLPSGGAAGEVLVKQSATDFDVDWGSRKDIWFPITQRLYGSVANATAAVATDTAHFSPVYFPVATQVDEITISIFAAGSAGAVVRLGIYTQGTDGLPDALILDAGTVAADSTGVKAIVVNETVTGLVWCVAVPQVAGSTIRSATGVNQLYATGTPTIIQAHGFSQSGFASGALPTTVTGALTDQSNTASVYLRVA